MPSLRRIIQRAALVLGLAAAFAALSSGSAGARTVWSSDFGSGNFREWSWWGQGQQDIWGHVAVVGARAAGVPALRSRYVARFQTTPDDLANGRENAKIFKWFTRGGRSPADVSGSYSAWYYLPRDFRMANRRVWINTFQFKERHGGGSDPLWWVQFQAAAWASGRNATWRSKRPRRATQPVMYLNHWGNPWTRREVMMTVPLGRWFEIRADVQQGRQIVFSVDGRRFDVARAREYPVNPFRGDSQEWIFGVGAYGTADSGPLYVGAASLTR